MSDNYKCVKRIIDDYCVLDTETTGLGDYDEVIEIGILQVRNNEVVKKYSQLIQPRRRISAFITNLTGITNAMVAGMPSIMDVKDTVLNFFGDDVILGHNVLFDIRFLNAGFGIKLSNPYMDTRLFAKKVYPELSHHKLSDLTEYLSLTNNEHRALADCVSTKELYDAIKSKMASQNVGIQDLWKSYRD